MADPDHPRHRYSQVTAAYDSPYYQPITPEQQATDLFKLQRDREAEAMAVDRNNIFRSFLLGTAMYCVVYPLQRLWQLQQVRPDVRFVAPQVNYRWTALKFVLQKEGGPHHLWRGVLPGAIYFNGLVASHWLSQDFMRSTQAAAFMEETNRIDDIFNGMIFTTMITAGQFAFHPFKVIQTKLATDIKVKSLSTWFRYTTSLDCGLRVLRYNGIVGLYRGALLAGMLNYIKWFSMWHHYNVIADEDATGTGREAQKFWPYVYPYRYEVRALQTYLALYPVETIISRRIYRVPTFKTDRLPHQFPRMWLPTWTGFISILRGITAFCFGNAALLLWSRFVQYRAEEELLPPHERPSAKRLLYASRYATYRRTRDELSRNVGQYPHIDPSNTGGSARMREEQNYSGTTRYLPQYSGSPTPLPGLSSSSADRHLPDLEGMHRGTYDLTATSFHGTAAGSSVPKQSVTNSKPFDI